MRVLLVPVLLLSCFKCIEFDKFYPSAQLFIYDKKWDSKPPYKDYVTKLHHNGDISSALATLKTEMESRNRQWVLDVKSNIHRHEFVNYMVNVPKTFVLTPDTIGEIDRDDFCWVMFAYNSRDWRHQRQVKSLLRGANEQFYERCGVATVDLSFPGNELMLGRVNWRLEVVRHQFPFILFKRPNTHRQMIDLHNREGVDGRIFPLHFWGELHQKKELGQNALVVFNHMLGGYERHCSENLKLMSVYMPHYRPNKDFMKSSIKKMIKVIQQEAKQDAMKHVTCHEEDEKCSERELAAQTDKAEAIYTKRFHEKLNGSDGWNLTDVMSIKIGAIPHVYDENNWGLIKDELVHLKPRTPLNIDVSLADWRLYFVHSEL